MAALDQGQYPIGIEVTHEQFNQINIERDRFHGEWNYKILPEVIHQLFNLLFLVSRLHDTRCRPEGIASPAPR